MAPTIFVGARLITTTYCYDDLDHPDRVTSTIASPAWTPEDQALLIALEQYEAELCKCNQPIQIAWHSETEGWWEAEEYICQACTAANDGKEVAYQLVQNTYPADREMPPFKLGETTTHKA